MSCSLAWRRVTLRSTKPSARSTRMATSFVASMRALVARLDPAGVDDHVVRRDARALHLDVAADAGAGVRDAAALPQRRLRILARAKPRAPSPRSGSGRWGT